MTMTAIFAITISMMMMIMMNDDGSGDDFHITMMVFAAA